MGVDPAALSEVSEENEAFQLVQDSCLSDAPQRKRICEKMNKLEQLRLRQVFWPLAEALILSSISTSQFLKYLHVAEIHNATIIFKTAQWNTHNYTKYWKKK